MNSYAERRKRAIELRRKGYSYNVISEKIGVAKSTLNYWLPSVPYRPNKFVIERIGKARAASGAAKARLKVESLEKALGDAKMMLGKMSKRDLFMLGIGLYMGEGGKTAQAIRFINSDPKVVQLAIKWFREIWGLTNKNFSPMVHLYPDNDIKKCLRYWSKVTQIPISQFGKTQVDRRVDKRMAKRGKLPYGTVHVYIRCAGNPEHGVFLFRKIIALIEETYQQSGIAAVKNAGVV